MHTPLLAAVVGAALAQIDMVPVLERGPLVLVEQADGGSFRQATAITLVNAPAELVWATVQKVGEFKTFMPKVLESEVTRPGDRDFDAHFVISVPGPDTDYRVRYTPDPRTRTMTGTWLGGDLKGSRWAWKVEPAGEGRALLHHLSAAKNFSVLAQSFDDEAQTITIGLNVSSALAAAQAVKKRCEELQAAAAPRPSPDASAPLPR